MIAAMFRPVLNLLIGEPVLLDLLGHQLALEHAVDSIVL
jgi:hypothetical protein